MATQNTLVARNDDAATHAAMNDTALITVSNHSDLHNVDLVRHGGTSNPLDKAT